MERVLLLDPEYAARKSVAISHDERTAAISDQAGRVRVVSVPSGDQQCSARIQLVHGPDFQRIALSPDGSRLIWADGHLIGQKAIDTATGEFVAWPDDMRFVTSAACFPHSIGCSPDARQIAVAHQDRGAGVIHIHDSASGELIHRLRHKDALGSVFAWSPDGKRIAALTANDALVLYDPATGRQIAELDSSLEPNLTTPVFSQPGTTVTTWTAGKNSLLRNVWHAPRSSSERLAR